MTTPLAGLRRDLGAFDFTLLVLGGVIGADVYVVASMGAGFLGPAQLAAWIVAGLLAGIIVLAFVQCALIVPEVGGTYAYTRLAFGPLAGFIAGWSLYLGESIVLPVFPTAFGNYLTYFVPNLSAAGRLLAGFGLLALVTGVNIVGVRASGRVNDVLTLAKLVPLAILMLAGLAALAIRPGFVVARLTPFAPLGWGGFGPALILIFLAYAGFELAVLPAGEVVQPQRTVPRGLVIAMSIATAVYVLSAFAAGVGLPWQAAAASPRPLADALAGLAGAIGLPLPGIGVLMSLGGLVSIGAAFDVYTLSVARLSYAMAKDGVLPGVLAKVHPRFGTPWVALLFQAAIGFSVGRLLDLTHLIDIAMFFIGLCYLATALAALRLATLKPDQRLHIAGLRGLLAAAALGGLYLSLQAPNNLKLVGLGCLAAGLAAYLIARRRGRSRQSGALPAGWPSPAP